MDCGRLRGECASQGHTGVCVVHSSCTRQRTPLHRCARSTVLTGDDCSDEDSGRPPPSEQHPGTGDCTFNYCNFKRWRTSRRRHAYTPSLIASCGGDDDGARAKQGQGEGGKDRRWTASSSAAAHKRLSVTHAVVCNTVTACHCAGTSLDLHFNCHVDS